MENISGTVNKAVDVLEIFLQADGELRLSDVAKSAKLDQATTYRLVSTLVKRHFLYQAKRNGKYSLGLKMFDCSLAIRRNLKYIDFAYLYLGKLNSLEKVTVNLTFLDNNKSLMVEEIGISFTGSAIYRLSPKTLPLYATACGKLFLASQSQEERMVFYRHNILEALNPNTVIDIAVLEKELETIRLEGIAYDFQNYRVGVYAIAAPLLDAKGKVLAAASIIVPHDRIDRDNVQHLVNALKHCVAEISQDVRQLG